MKPLSLSAWVALSVFVLAVVDHFTGRTAFGFVPAGLLIAFVGLEIRRAARAEIVGATLLATVGLAAAVASSGDLATIGLTALRRTESFFLLFAAIAWLRVPAEISPSIRQAQELAQGQPPGRRFLVLSLAAQALGAVLNLAGISLLAGVVRSAPSAALRRRLARALTQGFTSASCWTPFFVAMSIGLTVFPALRWSDVAPLGIAAALVLAALSWGMDRLLYHRQDVGEARSAEAGRAVSAARFQWRMGAVPVSLFVIVVTLVEGGGLPIPVALAVVAPAYALIWMSILTGRRAPLRMVAADLSSRVIGGLPGLRGEAVLFLGANLLGAGVSAVLPPAAVAGLLAAWALSPDVLIALVLVTIPGLAAVGVHPLVVILVIGEVVPAAVLGIPPAVFCAALVAMSGVGAVVSPFSATTLFMARASGLSVWQVAWLCNGPYGIVTTVVLALMTIMTRHLGIA